MKILHILSQRPEQTGSGVYITQMMRHAHAAGHENALLAGVPADYCHPVSPFCSRTWLVRFGTDAPAGLPHDVVGMSDVMPYPSTRFRDLSDSQLASYEACFAAQMRDAVHCFRPDIIHANHLWLASSLVRRLFPDIPVVVSSHGSDLRQFRTNPHLRDRVLAGCRSVDAVCALHSLQRQEICELYGLPEERVHVTGVGFDDELFSCELKPAAAPVRICYAGKLSAAKGVPWLLRAFERLEADVHLDLCGSGAGPERDAIVAHAVRLGGRVTLHGNLDHAALSHVMQQAHVFVLPSFYEGLPLVMLEALACGCRLVGTRLPGVEEVFSALPASTMRMVELPRLREVDSPFAEDEEIFVGQLADALAALAGECRVAVSLPSGAAVAAVLDSCTWAAVFGRVEQVYGQLESAPRAGARSA